MPIPLCKTTGKETSQKVSDSSKKGVISESGPLALKPYLMSPEGPLATEATRRG
jgi:hypothetical protein